MRSIGGLAHILEPGVGSAWWSLLLLGAVALLTLRHLQVKHRGSATSTLRRPVAVIGALIAVAALLPAGMPTVGARQANDGLPDLISDPPRPAFLKEIVDASGDARLVFTFDGYIHNIGDGPLEVVGNPQVEGGMVQRVREGGEWRDVAQPTVRYETDDGHDHFHLIEAVDYVLWNEDQGSQTAAGSKIGFCLVDSEQMEPGTDQAYSEELDDFCQEGNPTATSLRMGISSGWRDIYDATTTLQWVDVSDTEPGRYWIGAITDPNDEIVESDEDNNALVFSDTPAIVPGWRAESGQASSDGGPVEVELDATAFGTTGAPTYTIVEGPSSGSLDVPVGAAISTNRVIYTPDAGFSGDDRITFSVSDGASPYPSSPRTASVTIEVSGSGVGVPPPGNAPIFGLESTFFEMAVGEAFETTATLLSSTGTPVSLYAVGLPAGLRIEGDTITGAAVSAGFTDVELVAVDEGGGEARQVVTIIVNRAEQALLAAGVDRSSPLRQPVRLVIGRTDLTSEYSASGLPPGLSIDESAPVVSGVPSELGSWPVEVVQTAADGSTTTARFMWTVRHAVAIDFVV